MPAKNERTEELKARHREEQRRYQRTEEGKAYMRRYRETHRDAIREWKKRYAAEHQSETKATKAIYRFSNKQLISDYNRRYRAAHSDAVKAYNMAYYRRKISIMQVRTSPDEVYRRAIAALPSGLPRFIRDDVVSSLCLAVLEGQLNVNDIAAKAKEFLRAYNREYDTFQTVSLDVLIPGTKTTYLDALVAE